jgi:hypothetical protein
LDNDDSDVNDHIEIQQAQKKDMIGFEPICDDSD